jgi:hypothetical protein
MEKRDCDFFRNDLNRFRHILRMSGGSHSEESSAFCMDVSNSSIEVANDVQEIQKTDHNGLISLRYIYFISESHVKKIDGLGGCTSLCRIELPSSVEIIGGYGFNECISLNDISIALDSHKKKIEGFFGCISLCRIELP